jgi:predicted enzyme related to lactoylglutathione lyase
MVKNSNSLNWFEIPALDISRAAKFYETIFGVKMEQLNCS